MRRVIGLYNTETGHLKNVHVFNDIVKGHVLQLKAELQAETYLPWVVVDNDETLDEAIAEQMAAHVEEYAMEPSSSTQSNR